MGFQKSQLEMLQGLAAGSTGLLTERLGEEGKVFALMRAQSLPKRCLANMCWHKAWGWRGKARTGEFCRLEVTLGLLVSSQ